VGPQVVFGPEGLTFSRPVTLTFAVDPARLPTGRTASEVAIFLAPASSTSFTPLATRWVDATHVQAVTSHFSAGGPGVPPKPTPAACPVTTNPLVPAPVAEPGTEVAWTPDPAVLAQWDPTSLSNASCRPAFCDGSPDRVMSAEPEAHPSSRMARYHLDPDCKNHRPRGGGDRLCVKSAGPGMASVKATTCVDTEYITGNDKKSEIPSTEEDLICVQCPSDSGMTPAQGALCQDAQVDLGTRGYPIFNVRGSRIEKANAWFDAGRYAARGQARMLAYLNVARVLAPEFGFCEGTPTKAGAPEAPFRTETAGSSWRYKEHRLDLDQAMLYQTDGVAALECKPFNSGSYDTHTNYEFWVHYSALVNSANAPAPWVGISCAAPSDCPAQLVCSGGTCQDTCRAAQPGAAPRTGKGGCPPGLSCDKKGNCVDMNDKLDWESFLLALAHEMRHMGTENFGSGESAFVPITHPDDAAVASNQRIAGAEHMLNEVEDYTLMFQHPWFHVMSDTGKAQAKKDFEAGRLQERTCFAWEWGVSGDSGGFDGYPTDKKNSAPMFLLQATAKYADGTPVETGGACVGGGVLKPSQPPTEAAANTERCAVATWAANHNWMLQQMLLSMGIGPATMMRPGPMMPGMFPMFPMAPPRPSTPMPSGDPDQAMWNIMAHWNLGYPARMQPYCASDKRRP
jgi:hypothetical protein